MGKGKDTFTKNKQVNDMYQFNIEGTEKILKNWRNMREEQYYSTSWDIIDVFLDFEYALKSKSLTGDERLAIALIYSLELTKKQASDISNVDMLQIEKNRQSAIKKILEILDKGFSIHELHKAKKSNSITIEEYLEEVKNGDAEIFKISDKLNTNLLEKLAEFGEKNSQYALKQIEKENDVSYWSDIEGPFKVYTDYRLDRDAEDHWIQKDYEAFIDSDNLKGTKYAISKRNTQEFDFNEKEY